MSDLLLLVAALLIAAILGGDLIRGRLHSRRVQHHLQRLSSAGPATGEGRRRAPGALASRLRAAGLRVGPRSFIVGSVLAAAVVGLSLLRRFPGTPWVALISAGFMLYAPGAMVRAWGGFRARRFETKLVDALDFLVGMLDGGQNATQALASTAEAAEEPVKTAFRQASRRIALGMSIERAVTPMVESYDGEGTRIFTQALIAKVQAGGPLAPVLRSVNRIVRARLKLRMQLRGQLSGAQFAATFIAIVPYALIPIYAWRKPDWIDRLITHPSGPQMLFFAVVLQLFGFLWIRRILRQEV